MSNRLSVVDTSTQFTLFGKIVLISLVQTGGLSTFNQREMAPLGRLTTMILMFIGGSPNSMAGSIKTTTLFIILMFIFKIPNSKGDIRIKDKRINQRLIMRALRVFIYTLLITITSIVLIRIFEPNTISTKSIIFETISAISTTVFSKGKVISTNIVSLS